LFTLIALAGGFRVGADYVEREVLAPETWSQSEAAGLQQGILDITRWWEKLNDPQLNELIHKASHDNFTIQEAFARIKASRAIVGIARGEKVPDINASGSIKRNQISNEFVPPTTDFSRHNTIYALGMDASWELDFWGRITRSIASATADFEASVDDFHTAIVLIDAEVARSYVALRTLQRRLYYANSNVTIQQQSLKIAKARYKAKLTSALDVHQATLNLARTEALIPQLKAGIVIAINRLGVLVGEYPSALYKDLIKLKAIPRPPKNIFVGVPIDTIRQRPDILATERRLAAQSEKIGITKAELFPRFTLTGEFRFTGKQPNVFFHQNKVTSSYGPSFTWNLFDGKRIVNAVKTERALTEAAFMAYRDTVLNGFEEVESSMNLFTQETVRRKKLLKAVRAAKESVRLVQHLYRSGLTNFQNVLDMERDLFEQQDALAQSTGEITLNLITLYKALGGSWDT